MTVLFDRDHKQPKYFQEGTHRSRSPQETLREYLPLAPELGITRLANITGLDCIGVPVYACMRPNARGLSVSQGKGPDVPSAKVSAFMESVEHWHGERVTLAGRHESYAALSRESGAVVDIFALPLSKGAMPSESLPIWWVEGWDLLAGRRAWVPFEAVSTNFVLGSGRSTYFASSNGLASGNNLLEAVVHGLLEVIERDSHARWLARPTEELVATAIDLSSVTDPICRGVIDRIEHAGVKAMVFDMSCDLGVPAYFCALHERRDCWRPIGGAAGLGCHMSPSVALLRALTEAAQSRTTMIAGARDDMFYRAYADFGSAQGATKLGAVAEQAPGSRDFGARSSPMFPTFEEDLDALCATLRSCGVRSAIAVDLTKASIGISVAKLIVPGMENQAHVRSELRRSRTDGAQP